MTNRINGDFDQDSMEAFRSAYAAQILEPEDLELDPYTGLPSNVVLNTSPWIQHTGLWKANDGTDKNFVPNQILVPGEQVDEEISEEELDAMLEELLEEEAALEELEPELEDDEDDTGFTQEELDELVAVLSRNRQGEDDDEEDIDVDALVDELLGDLIEGDFETSIDQTDSEFDEEEIGDEEIDALIAELEAELETDEE